MNVRHKILALGLGLATVSILSVSISYSVIMFKQLDRQAREALAIKLDLLDNRISAAFDQLDRAGLGANRYYRDVAIQSIEGYTARIVNDGESIHVVEAEIEARQGPSAGAETDLTAGVLSLASLYGREPGMLELRIPELGPSAHLVAYKSFTPWGLLLAVSVNRQILYRPLALAMGLSAGLMVLLLAGAFALSFFMSSRLGGPLAELSSMAEAIGRGDFSARTSIRGGDELGTLGQSFNDMAARFETLTSGLEATVRKRTEELSSANSQLERLNDELRASLANAQHMQDQLVQAEKLSALGVLTAGIAHELNTPLGANTVSAELLNAFIAERLPPMLRRLPELPPEAWPLMEALARAPCPNSALPQADRRKRKELERRIAQAGVRDAHLWAERAMQLGLGDTVLSEAYLSTEGPTPLLSTLWDLCELRHIGDILAESGRKASMVVQALQSYVRPAEDEGYGPVDVDADLDIVLTVLHSKLKNIAVHRARSSGLMVFGISHQLSQVWINIINNAAQAMEYSGALSIRVAPGETAGSVAVEFEDEGPGIPPELAAKIFEPFFTTKKLGQGMGLGLDICKKIIAGHGGSISFESRPGRTVFTVTLPAAAEERSPGRDA